MFTGMTIEELIHSVERAESHAREEKKTTPVQAFEYPMYRMDWRQAVEVA